RIFLGIPRYGFACAIKPDGACATKWIEMKRLSIKKVYEGNWISVLETVYLTKKNETIVWESIERKRCKAGVVILAKLMPSNRFIIIKQFRAAIHGYVLGLPAG